MKMPSKTTITRSVITLLVLVVAVVAGSLFAQSRRPPMPTTIQLSTAQQGDAAYQEALDALSKEDTGTAITLLERAVALSPGNAAAQSKLAALKKSYSATTAVTPGSGTTPTSTPTSTPTTTPTTTPKPSGPDPFLGDIDLKKLLPTSLDGFKLGYAQVVSPDAILDAAPTSLDSSAQSVSWAIHDRKTESAAQAFVDNVSKNLYEQDAVVVNVRGTTAYFGTDGTRLATVAFRRGRYAYEVIVASQGLTVGTRALAERAAAAFPATP